MKRNPYIWGAVERVGVHHHWRSVSLEAEREEELYRDGSGNSKM